MNLGLRAKSVLALCLCMAVVSLLAWLAGRAALASIEDNLGAGFARNATRYSKQSILAPVSRELALSQQLARSQVTKRFLLDENDPAKRELFFAEARGYQKAFSDDSYFLVSRATRSYYFNDSKSKFSDRARYHLNEKKPDDGWFFATMKNTPEYNINVNVDTKLKVTKVWFNVMVKDGGRNIGLAGTGLDLTRFLDRFVSSRETGVTPMILNRQGAIQAHPNRDLIEFASVDEKENANRSTVYRLLPRAVERAEMKDALEQARKNPESIPQFWAHLGPTRELFAVSYIPELDWFVVNAVDVSAAQVVDSRLLLPFLVGGAALLALLVGAISFSVNSLILAPLFKLTDSAQALGAGHYNVELPPAGRDEMGDLTRAFGAMAAQVRCHTDELEGRVAARTTELVAANDKMAHANQQIGDSIQYASLIQNAILPTRELSQNSDHHFALWKPRDVVGGDFYVFRTDENGTLIGVVDCAGHGVPGAFMTMIAYAVLGVAMDTLGLENPARLLGEMDARLRAMLQHDPKNQGVATNMDAGLAYVDNAARTVTFAGAKISLYACDGQNVEETKGDRTSIGGKRVPTFSNKTVALNGQTTFYITSDGLLDQAGGEKGYGFGNARFADLMMRQSQRELCQQKAAFDAELLEYQGDLPQRDDVTLVSFRFD